MKLSETENKNALLPFLPLLYVAWSDAVLTPTEISSIEKLVKQQKWLTADEKEKLNDWLDPKNPPSATQVQNWLTHIRENSHELSTDEQYSLTDLGFAISDESPSTEKRVALQQMEELLGVLGEEASRDILGAKDPESPAVNTGVAVNKLSAYLDGRHVKFRKKVRQFYMDPLMDSKRIPETKKDYRELVFEWCQLCADQGWGALAYPKFAGGEDDQDKYFALLEEMGYNDLSLCIKFGVQFGLWGGSVYWLGTEKHHRKYLKSVGDLSLPGGFAMTEGGHGSNVRELETTATYDIDKQVFIIHTPNELARKEYIGNAAVHGQAATVFAQLITQGETHGVHAFVVPLRDTENNVLPGVRIEDNGLKLGLNGVDNGRIWFNQVEVPLDNLLDKFGSVDESGNYSSPISSQGKRFFTMLATLVGGRVGVPLMALSAAKTSITIAVKYACERKQFGPGGGAEVAIMDYQSHQRRLMPLVSKAYAFHFAQRYSQERYLGRSEDDGQEVEALAAGLKALCTWFCTDAVQECREACGGNGYLDENRFARLKADSDIFTTFEGDNTVLLQLVAKGRLSQFKKEFGSMGFMSTVRFISDLAATNIKELNPVITRSIDKEHLQSRSFYLGAFEYREAYLLRLVATRLRKRIKSGMDSYQAYIECQNMLLDMATAYLERVILEQFIAGVEGADAEIQPSLRLMERVYALSMIEENKAWYLENGYMEGRKSVHLSKLLEELCLESRQQCPDLVNAFGIPDALLAAPIAIDYPY